MDVAADMAAMHACPPSICDGLAPVQQPPVEQISPTSGPQLPPLVALVLTLPFAFGPPPSQLQRPPPSALLSRFPPTLRFNVLRI
jgi:hypothetical protein